MKTLINKSIYWGKNVELSYKPCNDTAALIADFRAAINKWPLNCLPVLNNNSQQ